MDSPILTGKPTAPWEKSMANFEFRNSTGRVRARDASAVSTLSKATSELRGQLWSRIFLGFNAHSDHV